MAAHKGLEQGDDRGIEPVLKKTPRDFMVVEILRPGTLAVEEQKFTALRLDKCGLTTFEGIGILADRLGISHADVGYAGLKDEDGVTAQTVTVPTASLALDRLADLNVDAHENRWLKASVSGFSAENLQVGDLLGNAFTVVVRGLPVSWSLPAPGLLRSHFVNYYDTQRFGVPGGPLTTDLIGGHLLTGDYDRALNILRAAGTDESDQALQHSGSAEMFFNSLDERKVAFFESSYFSAEWNEQLATRLRGLTDTREVRRRGRIYWYPDGRTAAAAAARGLPSELPYKTVRVTQGRRVIYERTRASLIPVDVKVGSVEADEMFDGKLRIPLSFVLPSGCYATMAVSQIVEQWAR